MGRPERPVDPDRGPVQRFAADLRALRRAAGNPTYREMADRSHYSSSALSRAASGYSLPTLAVTIGFVTACGADPEPWRARWHELAEATLAETTTVDTGPAGVTGAAVVDPAAGGDGGVTPRRAGATAVPAGRTSIPPAAAAIPPGAAAIPPAAADIPPGAADVPEGVTAGPDPAPTTGAAREERAARTGLHTSGGSGSSLSRRLLRPGGTGRTRPAGPGRRTARVGATVLAGAALVALATWTSLPGALPRTAGAGSGAARAAVGRSASGTSDGAGKHVEEAPASGQPVADGTDPKASGCAPDGITLDSQPLIFPAHRLAGTVELRYSPRCAVAWSRFVPAPTGRAPGDTVTVDVFRSADGVDLSFTISYGDGAVFSDVLRVHGCVIAKAWVISAGVRSPVVATGCRTGRTP